MAEYRTLEKDETPPVGLWSETFQLEPAFFETLRGDEDLSFAAFEDGVAVSSVHVFVREMRDRSGRPLRVGGIGSVSTHPAYRKQGHSGRLLEMALEGMERAGCVWSLLGTGVNDHYARHGWRTVSTPEPWGEIREGAQGEATALTPDDATLAALHAADTATRPLATVRTPTAWGRAIRYRLSGRTLVLGSYEGDRLAAYGVAKYPWDRWAIVEAAGDPGHLPTLLGAMAARLREEGESELLAHLPEGSAMDAFAGIVDRVHDGESRSTMLRPIADRIAWPDLVALYGDPRGRHGDLDAF